jgi:predicted DNA-binding antitoxin AbrB/MazE fold protein
MTTRTIRVKVQGGHLEPLDELVLPEGSETRIVVEIPEREPSRSAVHRRGSGRGTLGSARGRSPARMPMTTG